MGGIGGRSKILIAMIEVGWGHKGPALAIAEELTAQAPDACDVTVVDLPLEVGANQFDRAIKSAWDYSLAYPAGARILYSLMNVMAEHRDRIFSVANAGFLNKSEEFLRREAPDLVVATHPVCLHAAALIRERAGLDYLVAGYVVDPFDAYSLWAEPRADVMYVASEEARQRITEYGYPVDRVRITGFPFRKGFGEALRPRAEIRKSLGVGTTGNLVALASSGAQGIGRVYDVVERCLRRGASTDFIIVCGNNEKTRASLQSVVDKRSSRSAARAVVLGYVTNMPELMSAADVVVGKSGASTAMEAFALGKPYAFTDWSTQNDRRIIDWAISRHVGWWTPSHRRLGRLLRRLRTTGELDAAGRALESLSIRSGSAEVAAHLLELLGDRS